MDDFHSKTGALKIFHIDGAGARPDGTGSGFAWARIGTDKQRITREDGLTNNEAEYRALISVLMSLPAGSRAQVFTDSQLVCQQFNGAWSVRDPMLSELLSSAQEVIGRMDLRVEVKWIPRAQNRAGALLERKKKR